MLNHRLAGFTAALATTLALTGSDARNNATKPISDTAKSSADAERVASKLRAMRNYLVSRKTFSVVINEAIDEKLPSGQIVSGDRTVTLHVRKPNRLHMRVQTGIADTVLYYDGKSVTVHGKRLNFFATQAAPSSLPALAEFLAAKLDTSLPLSDFLSKEALDAMIEHAETGTYVGLAMVDGIECDQIAFKQGDLEWQLWIQTGKYPVPRKLAITQHEKKQSTRFVAHLAHWQLGQKLQNSMFKFRPPADAIKINFEEVDPPSKDAKETSK